VLEVQKDSLEIFSLDDGDKIQKKITPWKEMLENEELNQDRKPANPDLILVASLVDRPPNLVIFVFVLILKFNSKRVVLHIEG
jgi:hypothetical protein